MNRFEKAYHKEQNRHCLPLMYKGFLFRANKDGEVYPKNLSTGIALNIQATPQNVQEVKKLIDNIK